MSRKGSSGLMSETDLVAGRHQMTPEEQDWVWRYSVGSATYNSYLREPEKLKGLQDLDEISKGIPAIDNVIANSTLSKSITVYRTIDSAYFPNLEVGSVINDKAYNSTSTLRSVAESVPVTKGTPVLVEIKVPKGKGRGVYIGDVAAATQQHEFLIKRNARYRVVGKSGNVLKVVME